VPGASAPRFRQKRDCAAALIRRASAYLLEPCAARCIGIVTTSAQFDYVPMGSRTTS
jgi:hypothetical protein